VTLVDAGRKQLQAPPQVLLVGGLCGRASCFHHSAVARPGWKKISLVLPSVLLGSRVVAYAYGYATLHYATLCYARA